jgi:type II secretory pathway pseudopilin PulG
LRVERRRFELTAFTLIELLVVIGIIGTLMGISIPAIQAARESSRAAACRNRVAQIATGLHHLESAMRAFPPGGWGDQWLGVPERGTETRQPGGWIFATLPYIEQKPLYQSVEGLTAATAPEAYAKLASASLPMFACPSRRSSRPLPISATAYKSAAAPSLQVSAATRSDYVGNGGSSALCPSLSILSRVFLSSDDKNTKITFCHAPRGNPDNDKTQTLAISSILNGGHATHDGDHFGSCDSCGGDVTAANPQTLSEGDAWTKKQSLAQKLFERPDNGMPELQDGVFFRMSRMQPAAIRDGLSNTYLVGEKYVPTASYTTGSDGGDDRPMFVGYSDATIRWAAMPPAPDRGGSATPTAFGSPHRSGWNVALADGSVRMVSFEIDATVHRHLASRSDGQLLPGW